MLGDLEGYTWSQEEDRWSWEFGGGRYVFG